MRAKPVKQAVQERGFAGTGFAGEQHNALTAFNARDLLCQGRIVPSCGEEKLRVRRRVKRISLKPEVAEEFFLLGSGPKALAEGGVGIL